MQISSEVFAALLGAVIGAFTAFFLGLTEKFINQFREKRLVKTLLKIEMGSVAGQLKAYSNAIKVAKNEIVNFKGCNNLDSFMIAENLKLLSPDLLQKVMKLHGTIKSANELSVELHANANNQGSFEFQSAYFLYPYEMKTAVDLCREIMMILKMDDLPNKVPEVVIPKQD